MRTVPFLCVICSVALFVSCLKESSLEPRDAAPSNVQAIPKTGGGFDRKWKRDTNGDDHRCPPNGNRCTRITFLSDSDRDRIFSVLAAVRTGDHNMIKNVFVEHSEVLVRYVDARLIGSVVNGEQVPTALRNEQERNDFLIFGEEPEELVHEVPW